MDSIDFLDQVDVRESLAWRCLVVEACQNLRSSFLDVASHPEDFARLVTWSRWLSRVTTVALLGLEHRGRRKRLFATSGGSRTAAVYALRQIGKAKG